MTIDTFDITFIKYNPKLGEILGRGASMFVGALQFLLKNQNMGVEKEGKKWVYNTSEQWAQYIGYSSRQIERIVSKLSNHGIIIVQKLNRCKANRTNYYAIDEAKLEALLQEKEAKKMYTSSSTSNRKKYIKNRSFIDRKSKCFRHEDGFFTKKTNKEINSISEKKTHELSDITTPIALTSANQKDQAKQVKKIKFTNDNTQENSEEFPHIKKPTIAQEMLSIWNKALEKSPTLMSKQLAPLLVAAYKSKFSSDIRQWERYCRMIASSAYLTGESFSLSLLWALKYTTIERVKNLDFGVKDILVTSLFTGETAVEQIQAINEPLRCKEVRLKLLKIYGPAVYLSWIKDLELFINNEKVCFKAPNNFIKDHVKNKIWGILGKI